MPIICLEGASAVGKTTVSAFLRENYGASVIPEVNLLFERPATNEPKFWYFERQIERWQKAQRAVQNHKIVILDGDPFQPLWYNWAYDYDFGDAPDEIARFYRKALAAGEIDFPDRYFILNVKTDALRWRKANDILRTRKTFERHLRFIEPQKDFFEFIKSIDSDLVEFVENVEIEKTARKVMDFANTCGNNADKPSRLELFDKVEDWLKNHKPEEFICP